MAVRSPFEHVCASSRDRAVLAYDTFEPTEVWSVDVHWERHIRPLLDAVDKGNVMVAWVTYPVRTSQVPIEYQEVQVPPVVTSFATQAQRARHWPRLLVWPVQLCVATISTQDGQTAEGVFRRSFPCKHLVVHCRRLSHQPERCDGL